MLVYEVDDVILRVLIIAVTKRDKGIVFQSLKSPNMSEVLNVFMSSLLASFCACSLYS